ncbi:MAG: dipeptide ABC transporter ATP-binding protein [Saprospiraceae bacterium]|nr:dipeptide ABC transporter ATP-binding protein [Saprospiraceae bacterium]
MSDQQKLLSVSQLAISFPTADGELKALKGSSFDLYRGEVLGIVGESGSGKSMTALSILQLLPSSAIWKSGSIDLCLEEDSLRVNELSPKELQGIRGNRVSMIFQDPMSSLNPVHTCGQQVAEVLILHKGLSAKAAKSKVCELFEQVQLPDVERIYQAYPHQLSGGQKQRIMIAMAIATTPDLIIADEPTTSLDVTVQQEILKLLLDLKVELNIGVLFISHDLGVISEIADRVLVMRKGEIVERGTKVEILKHPKHPYTQGLLACRPPLGRRLRRLPTISDFQAEQTHSPDAWIYKPTEYRAHLEKLEENPTILEVQDLQTWYPSKKNFWGRPLEYVKAVDGVSFQIKSGESIGLVGESGCGKTTLGKTLIKLIQSRHGQILFEGTDITDLDEQQMRPFRKKMQIVFQDPFASLNPRKMIGHAIAEPMEQYFSSLSATARKEKTIQLLEKVGLEADHFFRYPHEFSGGQRQRIAIARALAVEPEFLICDESVSSLDVSVQAQILNLLTELREESGLSYIFISHDLSVVKFMADRMLVMKDGKVVEQGLADEVYLRPKTAYTKKLIEAIPDSSLAF